MTFVFRDGSTVVRSSGLGFLHNVSLSPRVHQDDPPEVSLGIAMGAGFRGCS
jgi:hypothetical protein